jgi:hypothetical protein
MLRFLSLFLVPAALLLVPAPPAQAYWQPPAWRQGRRADLAGRYVNTSNGRECSVARTRRGYLFTNENGSPAWFVYTAPRRLEQVSGEWDPAVVCIVLRGRFGRPLLRFDSPNSPSGYWRAID